MFLILLIAGAWLGSPNEETLKDKCELEFLEGQWYGEFTFYTGTTFHMNMEVQRVRKCEIEGILRWPDYFNSETTFKGKLENGELRFTETKILQGMIMDIDRSFYTLSTEPSDTLTGTAYVDDDDVATFRIFREKSLKPEKRNYYLETFDELDSVYGVTKIEETADISLEVLKERHQENVPKDFLPKSVKIVGKGVFNQITMPIVMYYDAPSNLYMEMEFQRLKFLFCKKDSVTWSYDPTKDELNITEGGDGSDSFNEFSNDFLKNVSGEIDDVRINRATVDGEPAYRVAFKRADDVEAYYLSTDHYRMIREERNYQVKHFLNYTSIGDEWTPTVFLQMSPGGTVNAFYFDDITEDPAIPENLFAIPDHLKSKIKKVNASGPSVVDLADAALREKNYKRAEELYSKAINNYAYDDELYFNRGIARYELGENYSAISDFERAIDLNDKVGDYYNRRGLVKYRLGDYENAKSDFLQALDVNNNLHVAYLNAAFAAYHLDQPDSAINYLDTVILKDSTNGQYFLNRGIIRSEQEHYEEAIADYQRSLQYEYGDRAETENRIGVAFFRQENYEEAARYFQLALAEYPENYQMQKNLANSYYFNEQYKEATSAYHKAFELKDNDADLLNYLAMSYYHQDDYKTAVYYLDKTIELDDSNANYFDSRAYAYAGMMRYQEAIRDFTTSIELYSKDMEVFYQRGLLLKIQNNRFDACRDFQKAADMGHEAAAEELTELCLMEATTD